MGQKIHPLGLRLGVTQQHRSIWCVDTANYPRFIMEERLIRNYLLKKFPNANIVDIIIEHLPTLYKKKTHAPIETLSLKIYTANYGELLDPKNKIESLKVIQKDLLKLCRKEREKSGFPTLRMRIDVRGVKEPYTNASIIAGMLIEKLEQRIPFRPALKSVVNRLLNNDDKSRSKKKKKKGLQEDELKELKGVRIQISGRLNGAEIARTEWTRKGRVPLQTLRADVDYASKTAKTIYGILGIKVWAFKKENF